ncbi:MAG: HlyD family efflux transporter periplasmic adaptor subunit [Ruminococcus flavefaciens]
MTQITAEEGAYVKAGDVLIELDTQSIDIDIDNINNQVEVLKAQKKIYDMISAGKDVSDISVTHYSSSLQPYITAITETDKAYHNNLSILESAKENAGLTRDIANIKLEEFKATPHKTCAEYAPTDFFVRLYRNSAGILTYVKEFLCKMTENMSADSVQSRQAGFVRCCLKNNDSVSQAEYDAQKLVVKQAENNYIQAETNVLKAQISYSEQINSQISEITGKLKQAEFELEKYNLSIENQKITAPVNSYINTISVNNIGDTVTAAQQVITLVPADIPVEMVCYIKNMDIADIKTGMEAEIKLEAYPYNKYGTVKGTVKYISPSSFNTEKMGSVYLVKLDVENTNPDINVMSGLSGTVEVKLDRRSVMSYFLEPITKGFKESLKEK